MRGLSPYRMMVPRKDGGYDTREYSLLPAGVYNKVDYLWQLTGNAAAFYYGVLWNKLYRRDLIQMAHIRFEHVVYAEDQLFNTRWHSGLPPSTKPPTATSRTRRAYAIRR